MRAENIEITMKIPIPIDKPDGNGIFYTKECVKKAVEKLKSGLPIITDPIDNPTCIGHVNKVTFLDDENAYLVNGVIYHGGTCEDIFRKHGTNTVTSMEITSFGLCKK